MQKTLQFGFLGVVLFAMFTQFSNCGQYQAEDLSAQSDTGKVSVSSSVWPRTDSTISNPIPLSISRSALPLAIDFGTNPDFYEETAITSWGAWLSAWHDLSSDAVAALGQPKFLYRLSLQKNYVIDLTTGEVIHKLSSGDAKKIAAIIDTSTLATATQFKNSANCTPSAALAYATLETDYGLFDLGVGAPCSSTDLFKNGVSGKAVGLQDFLKKLENKIN